MRRLEYVHSLRFLLLLTATIFFAGDVIANTAYQAQQRVITGTVSDELGEPLLGATVQIKGTTRGTQTGINGEYRVQVNEGEVLVFSYIGYKTLEISITDQTVLDVVLEIDETVLEEVVVVGYGTQKKSTLRVPFKP